MGNSKKNKKQDDVSPDKKEPLPPEGSLESPSSKEEKNGQKSKSKNNKEINNLLEKINQAELQRALNKWSKSKDLDTNIIKRDFNHLSQHVGEYLESYMLFGYDLHGQRVMVYSLKSPKDTDAIIEFLKKIFMRQQTADFLSEPTNDMLEEDEEDLEDDEEL